MLRESEPSHIEVPDPSFDSGRRRFLITTTLLVTGGALAAIGVVEDRRVLDEVNDLGTRLLSSYWGNQDTKAAMKTVEDLKMDSIRRSFIRDRFNPALIFGGCFTILIGFCRLIRII